MLGYPEVKPSSHRVRVDHNMQIAKIRSLQCIAHNFPFTRHAMTQTAPTDHSHPRVDRFSLECHRMLLYVLLYLQEYAGLQHDYAQNLLIRHGEWATGAI